MDQRLELPFATLLWQPRPLSWLVTVVCKATFSLAPGELSLAPLQIPVTRDDTFWDDDFARSLATASDLVPSKPKADVVLVGSAFALHGAPVRTLIARLTFGSIDKSVEIVTDRSVGPDGTVYQGPRFARMPLVYERAAGGANTSNPAGVRRESRDAYGRAPLPNITAVGKGDEMSAAIEPIGFGPIAPSWPERQQKLGKYGSIFGSRGWKNEPLPDGIDHAYFNVAPADQQVDTIPEDGVLLLEGFSREHASLKATLPGIRPLAIVERGGKPERPAMRADTLWIDTDQAFVTVVWRGHVQLESQHEMVRVTVHAEKPRQSWQTALAPAVHSASHLDALANLETASTEDVPRAVPKARAGTFIGSSAQPTPAALPFQNIARASERQGSRAALPFAAPAADAVAASGAALSSVTPFAPMPAVTPAVVAAQRVAPPSFGVAPVAPRFVSSEVWSSAATPSLPPAIARPVGAVSASNAAADPSARAAASRAPRRIEGDVLDLLWCDPAAATRVRRKPEWKGVLATLSAGTFDLELDAGNGSGDPDEIEAQREINHVLSRGLACASDAVDHALYDAVRPDGRFVPTLMLLNGELHFEFDEVETLKATIAAATPFANADDELKKSIDAAQQFLSTPGVVAAPEVSSGMAKRVRDAFRSTKRVVVDTYLDDQTERVLLERRAFRTLPIFGAAHLRCMFHFPSTEVGIPTYLPEPLRKKLPLFRRVRARMLAEAHFRADQYETHPAALKPVAIARIVR